MPPADRRCGSGPQLHLSRKFLPVLRHHNRFTPTRGLKVYSKLYPISARESETQTTAMPGGRIHHHSPRASPPWEYAFWIIVPQSMIEVSHNPIKLSPTPITRRCWDAETNLTMTSGITFGRICRYMIWKSEAPIAFAPST